MTEHRLFAKLSENTGLIYEMACIDHDYKDCAVQNWFYWDTAGAVDGYEGADSRWLDGAQIIVTEASEDGFAWYYA